MQCEAFEKEKEEIRAEGIRHTQEAVAYERKQGEARVGVCVRAWAYMLSHVCGQCTCVLMLSMW
jgi:hypothetical protein